MNVNNNIYSRLLKGGNGIYYTTDKELDLPSELEIDGIIHFRFCDFILIPETTEKLNFQQVLTVSTIREEYFEDYTQFKINSIVRKCFQKIIKIWKPQNLLEIGPGSFPLIINHKDKFENVFLADFNKEAIKTLSTRNIICEYFGFESTLKISDNSIDCIFAIFVFHFKISNNQIKELFRVLSPNGILIANIYRRTDQAKNKLLKNFIQQDYHYRIIPDPFCLCRNHEYWFLFKNTDEENLSKAKMALSKK